MPVRVLSFASGDNNASTGKCRPEWSVGGVTLTALGVGTGVLVSTIEADGKTNEEEVKSAKTIGYLGSGLMVGMGIITLALPSEAENHYRDVKTIDDPVARENAAYGSLLYCAEKGQKSTVN